ELDGGPHKEAIRPVDHPQLEQLSLRSRPRLARHGREYTHAPMPRPQPGSPSLSVLREAVASRFDRYLAELGELVNIDCGSFTPEGVNAVATHVQPELARL